MRSDYLWGLCPVIDERDLNRARVALKSRKFINDTTKTDTQVVKLDGDDDTFVMFDWDEKTNMWRLRNKLVLPIRNQEEIKMCFKCGISTKHDYNNSLTKCRCLTCNTITNL